MPTLKWSVLIMLLLTGCATSDVRLGQRLFAGCVKAVDDAATLKKGEFVCKGAVDPAPFGGNGRSCGSCHMPGDNFSISVTRIAALDPNHPLFFKGLDEDPELLRKFALIHVVVPTMDEFRQTPKLTHLRDLCTKEGRCDGLGLRGDRVEDLGAFTLQAITNHLSKTTARVPGRDFRIPTDKELKAITAYQLSDLVADQDER